MKVIAEIRFEYEVPDLDKTEENENTIQQIMDDTQGYYEQDLGVLISDLKNADSYVVEIETE